MMLYTVAVQNDQTDERVFKIADSGSPEDAATLALLAAFKENGWRSCTAFNVRGESGATLLGRDL